LAWIDTHEGLERGWYAAPIGWVGKGGDGVFAVAIRSVLLRGGEANLFAGAGLVSGSNPEAEWAETELKLRTVSDALSAASSEEAL
jgi:salicylate biosynthesis isochorismate synthase